MSICGSNANDVIMSFASDPRHFGDPLFFGKARNATNQIRIMVLFNFFRFVPSLCAVCIKILVEVSQRDALATLPRFDITLPNSKKHITVICWCFL